jgi:plasmid stabilization system protein ParE
VADRRVEWTAIARADLEAIIDYLAADTPVGALAVLDQLAGRATELSSQPLRGRVVPELRTVGVQHYRELIERPWRLIYRVESHRVLVMAVLDGRRDLPDLLLQRLVRD